MLPHPTLDKLQTLRLTGMLKALAEQLALLKEGAIATSHVRDMPEAAGIARQIAEGLVAASIPDSPPTR